MVSHLWDACFTHGRVRCAYISRRPRPGGVVLRCVFEARRMKVVPFMMKTWWIGVLCAGLALLALGWYLGQGPAAPTNVVFILVDTLRADRVEAQRNGQPVAPFLRELANNSLYCSNAVSPSSWTKPAMASLLTSAYVDSHQVYFSARNEDPGRPVSDALPGVFETMAEFLSRHGYDTWAYQTNANLIAPLGFAQGFRPDRYLFSNGARAEEVTSKALEAIPSMKPPFFMYLHYMDPHAPYDPPEKYAALFGPEPKLTDTEYAAIAPDQFIDYLVRRTEKAQEGPIPPSADVLSLEGREVVRQRYDEEIRFTDDQVALFIKNLRRKYPKTLFVVASDHGEEFWEHGALGHSSTLYEEAIRVPVIFNAPDLAPRRVSGPVESLGILPSIAAYLDLDPNPSWQGPNLLAESGEAPRPAFSRTYGSWPEMKVDLESVIADNRKFVADNKRRRNLLFDLAADPAEQHDLMENNPEAAAPFETMLERQRADNARRQAPRAAETAPAMDDEAREQLEALGYVGKTEKPAAVKKNVVLIVVDTLRGDRLHAQHGGVPVMPKLAAFAQTAWEFKNAYAQATWTKPSVVSMLTSLYPATHHTQFGIQAKMVENQDMTIETIPENIETAGQFFKQAGYTTAAVQTNWHLQPQYGFGRGFDTYVMDKWQPAEKVTSDAIGLLDQINEPFFLYAHYFDPHATYDPPEAYKSMFGPVPEITNEDRYLLTAEDYHQGYYLDKLLHDIGQRSNRRYGAFTGQGREYIRYMYDGECRYIDDEVMRLIDYLRNKGDTIVVFVSDHGEEFWEHGSIGHSKTVYHELTHVPMIMKVPGMPPAAVDTPVETIDILPTIAAQLAIGALPAWQGRDVAALAQGRETEGRPVFSETRGSIREAGLFFEMALEGDNALIVDHRQEKAALYNVAADPGETANLAESEPETFRRLQRMLDEHHRRLQAHELVNTAPVETPLDPETRAQLEALGYLEKTKSN